MKIKLTLRINRDGDTQISGNSSIILIENLENAVGVNIHIPTSDAQTLEPVFSQSVPSQEGREYRNYSIICKIKKLRS